MKSSCFRTKIKVDKCLSYQIANFACLCKAYLGKPHKHIYAILLPSFLIEKLDRNKDAVYYT